MSNPSALQKFMNTINYRIIILAIHVLVGIFYAYLSYTAITTGQAIIDKNTGIAMGVIGVGMIC
jgi:hypothetical protein